MSFVTISRPISQTNLWFDEARPKGSVHHRDEMHFATFSFELWNQTAEKKVWNCLKKCQPLLISKGLLICGPASLNSVGCNELN